MRIGIFDSGLGGLLIAQALIGELPEYDYVYLGDTKRVPYGNRSQEAIFEFTREAVDYLFRQDCQLVILACNTASAEALRRIQQEYLPTHYPDRRVLGVIIPAVESVVASDATRVGILATASTVRSEAYVKELTARRPELSVIQQESPLLVPLIEFGGMRFAEKALENYFCTFDAEGVDALILGCTHYSALKGLIRTMRPQWQVLSHDEILPDALRSYLEKHEVLRKGLSLGGTRRYLVTDPADYSFTGLDLRGESLQKVDLPQLAQ